MNSAVFAGGKLQLIYNNYIDLKDQESEGLGAGPSGRRSKVISALRRFQVPPEEFRVILTGGVFKNENPLLCEMVCSHIHRVYANIKIEQSFYKPIIGAVLLSLDEEEEKTDAAMQIIISENETDFFRETAARIAQVMWESPCSKIRVFAIDEITNMSRECKASCYAMLLNEVVRPLGILMEHFIMPNPFGKDIQKESAWFRTGGDDGTRAGFDCLDLGKTVTWALISREHRLEQEHLFLIWMTPWMNVFGVKIALQRM